MRKSTLTLTYKTKRKIKERNCSVVRCPSTTSVINMRLQWLGECACYVVLSLMKHSFSPNIHCPVFRATMRLVTTYWNHGNESCLIAFWALLTKTINIFRKNPSQEVIFQTIQSIENRVVRDNLCNHFWTEEKHK